MKHRTLSPIEQTGSYTRVSPLPVPSAHKPEAVTLDWRREEGIPSIGITTRTGRVERVIPMALEDREGQQGEESGEKDWNQEWGPVDAEEELSFLRPRVRRFWWLCLLSLPLLLWWLVGCKSPEHSTKQVAVSKKVKEAAIRRNCQPWMRSLELEALPLRAELTRRKKKIITSFAFRDGAAALYGRHMMVQKHSKVYADEGRTMELRGIFGDRSPVWVGVTPRVPVELPWLAFAGRDKHVVVEKYLHVLRWPMPEFHQCQKEVVIRVRFCLSGKGTIITRPVFHAWRLFYRAPAHPGQRPDPTQTLRNRPFFLRQAVKVSEHLQYKAPGRFVHILSFSHPGFH